MAKTLSKKLKRVARVDDDTSGKRFKVGGKEFTYTPFEQNNRLYIDEDLVKNTINLDHGSHLQWCAETVLGQPQDEAMSARRKNGYTEVIRGCFGGALDHLCDRDDRVTHGGQVLMYRPIEIERYARKLEAQAAKDAVGDMRRKHSEEGIGVSGGDHPSALRNNRHRRSYSVPE